MTDIPETFWWPLWSHMHNEHGLILMDDECHQIALAADEARLAADPAPEQWRSQCLVARIQRDELAGYLCRIKLPLPVRFVADLAMLFPGTNIRMKDVDGHLCIFEENACQNSPTAMKP